MDENKISNKLNILNQIYSTIEKRKNNENDEDSYVSSLFNDGLEKINSKIAEEAEESIEASSNGESEKIIY